MQRFEGVEVVSTKHRHGRTCRLCGVWPPTSWTICFEVAHCGQGFHFEGGISHVCEECARSNRHLRPEGCWCPRDEGVRR